MKKTLYLLLLACIFSFYGCDDSTEDQSIITYYVTFEMLGEETVLVEIGTDYTDAGVIAMEGTEDITSSVEIIGEVDVNTLGMYTITYNAVNKDGYASFISRTVYVYNPAVTTDISGEYTVAAGSNRYAMNTEITTGYSGYPITLTLIAPGLFNVSDFFGGYYDKRAEYGSSYAMTGIASLNEDNTLSLVSSLVAGWGDSLDALNDAVYDPEKGTITWTAQYAGTYNFNVILE